MGYQYYRTVILGLGILFHLTDSTSELTDCPCNVNSTTQVAECSALHLTMVPACIPNSIQTFILMNNDFEELHPKQFRRFKNLLKLDLLFNKIKRLGNSSFNALPELRILNLGCNDIWDIHSGFFTGISKLQELSIFYNDLKHLNESLFIGLSTLTHLDLSHNRLHNISERQFIGLKNLVYLNLTSCYLYQLNENIFTGLSSLVHLNIGDNYLTYLSNGLFAGLNALKYLSLNDNPLYFSTSFPTDIFQPLINLEELHLVGICYYNNRLHDNCTYIDEQLSKVPSLKRLCIDGLPKRPLGLGFASLENLEEIRMGQDVLSRCRIGTISKETFESLRNTRSLKLVLTDCKINKVLPYTFSPLINLTALDLSSNRHLCDQGLYNLMLGLNATSIKYLYLSEICSVDWEFGYPVVEGLRGSELEVLDLSSSSISSIGPEIFKELPKSLNVFYLHHNKLDRMVPIYLIYLHYLDNLLKLDLSHQTSALSNRHMMHKVAHNTTEPVKNIFKVTPSKYTGERPSANGRTVPKTLSEPGNRVEHTVQNKHLENRLCFHVPARLEWVDISDSRLLCCILPFLCTSDNSIKTLKASGLKYNNLCSIDNFWMGLKNLSKLKDLDLSRNHIKNLPKEVFSRQKVLRKLSLSGNSLVILRFETKNMFHLETLDLSDNNIQYASNLFTTEIEHFARRTDVRIYLEGNQLICDCDRTDFVLWLQNTKVINNKDDLMCKYENGSQVSLKQIAGIHKLLEAQCIVIIVTVSCVVGFTFLLLVLSIAALIYYKRWKLRYLLSIGRRNVNPYHPIEECHIEMEYDIYISYERDYFVTSNETLHEFVTQKLYPGLQQQGFKVIIRDELDIGMKLYDVISRTLRKCRKVIVLLSNDYCMDYWNIFEFNMAVMEGIYTKRNIVISVTFETLNPMDLHEEVFSFLNSEPVLKYTSDTDFTVLTEYLSDRVR